MDPKAFDPQAIIENFRRIVTEHYFDMKGRVGLPEFWYFILCCVVLSLAAGIIDGIVHTGILSSVVSLALLLPTTGMGARRLQDSGRNGQLVWLAIIPIAINRVLLILALMTGPIGALGFFLFIFAIGWIFILWALVASIAMIYFWIQPGTEGPNAYGPVPPPMPAAAKPAA